MKNILTNKWFKFSLVLIIYLLWAYWVGSWWCVKGTAKGVLGNLGP